MLTEKENYLMTLRGEVPEWVPRNMYASPGHPPATGMAMPSIMFGPAAWRCPCPASSCWTTSPSGAT